MKLKKLKEKHKIVYIIGKGSIGKRHSKILNKLGLQTLFVRRNISNSSDEIKISEINKKKLFFSIVCNPTSLHVEILKKLLKFNKPILVEKPLFNKPNLKFLNSVRNKKLIFTTYQMRFDPRIEKLKKLIANKKKLISFISWQTYLPKWHVNENYKNSYASQKRLGGGAILTMSHEIDLAIYLFGKIQSIKIIKLKNDLKIDVEDKIIIYFKHYNGSISNIYLNFASPIIKRNIRIFSKDKYYEWDFFNKFLNFKYKDKYKKYFFNFKNDEIYEFQLKDFIKKLKYNKLSQSRINFQNTYYTQKILDKIKKIFLKLK